MWKLPKEKNNIVPALWLSYRYLHSHLKRCFAYCSIFPKDYEINKEEIRLRMAENLIQPQRNRNTEEVGELGEICLRFDDINSDKVLSKILHVSHVKENILVMNKCVIEELPKPIGDLKFLMYLNLSETLIEELPNTVCTLYNLQTLLLKRCVRLRWLPTNMGRLTNFRHLDITSTGLEEFPLEIGKLKGLENVVDVADTLVGNSKDKKYLTKLQFLWDSNPEESPKTTKMNGKSGSLLEKELLSQILRSYIWKILKIYDSCDSMRSIVLDCLLVLSKLDLEFCVNLKSLEFSQQPWPALYSLRYFKLTTCPKFVSFPPEGLAAPNIEEFRIEDCKNLRSLPENMSTHLPSFQSIFLISCPQLVSFPECGLRPNINKLKISWCNKLFPNRFQWDLQRFNSLKFLEITSIDEELDSFPEEGLLPTTLVDLHIIYLPHLKSLNDRALKQLDSLKSMSISSCNEL
ncbi:putative disease resistance protein At3g14460 [Ziziphus jujuba]|uniref:Disease resistance protein At3g14460 n=1 Tax=Ziziphus jujuba TaxID=326968 RepID=A0ABM3IKU6_ZIZJJ|nr:putative disease resistance protein At3g14460 [Ziziphus jujuba]